MLFSFKHGLERIGRIERIYGAWWMCSYEAHRPWWICHGNLLKTRLGISLWQTHTYPATAGHHKSTIITNATHVLWQLLKSNQTDAMSYRTSSCMSVGLMAHVSSIGNIRDLIPFRLPTGQTRQVGRFRQASSLAWMNITTWLHGRKPGERKQVPSV